MACFGSLADLAARLARFPEFRAALAYAADATTPGSPAHARILALAAGATHREELPGGAHAIEMAYLTKPRSEGFFETHRRFIDVQVVIAGEERMEVAPVTALGIVQPYDAAKDFTKHTDAATPSVLRVGAGQAAVFWPEDAHMPSLAVDCPARVCKTVIKVPVPH